MSFQSEVLVNASGTLSYIELTTVELFKRYPDGLLKFATFSCVIIMIIGIPGNIITITALARYKKVRNATAIFIMNLSFSDLLFCFNIPLAASVFHRRAWIHGQILCKISLFSRYILFANSLFTILAITINRYILIAYPKLYTKIYKTRNIIIMVLFSWMFSFGLIILPIVFEKYDNYDVYNGSCSILKDRINRPLRKVMFLMAFILTCIAIILCYGRIFCIVQKTTKKSLSTGKLVPIPKESSLGDPSVHPSVRTSVSVRVTGGTGCNYMSDRIKIKILPRIKNTTYRSPKMEISDKIIRQPKKMEIEPPRLRRTTFKKSIKFLKMALPTRKDRRLGIMIIAIIISFFLCHLPITITKLFPEKNLPPKLNIAAHILFFLSFCINPIIYVVMSNKYRKAYKNLFKRRKPLLSLSKTKNPT